MSAAVTTPSRSMMSAEPPRFLRVEMFEPDFFQIQDDVGHVLDDAGQGAEFVLRALDFDRGDGGAFERGKQHAAQGVAEGVAVSALKRLGGEFGVGVGGGGFILLKPGRHLETSKSDWHGVCVVSRVTPDEHGDKERLPPPRDQRRDYLSSRSPQTWKESAACQVARRIGHVAKVSRGEGFQPSAQ